MSTNDNFFTRRESRSFSAADVPRVPLSDIGIIHRRRRVSQKAMHKSRIHEVLASGKPAFSKRKWR